MRKDSKKKSVICCLLALIMLFAGILASPLIVNATVNNTQFTVSRGGTEVRLNPTGNAVAVIGQGLTFTRTASAPTRSGNWTWINGRLNGNVNNAPAGTSVWISASQLARISSGTTCIITDPNGSGFTSVRNNPTAPNAGTIWATGAYFMPSGDARVTTGGFTWILGTVFERQSGGNLTNGWGGQTVWIATSQFGSYSSCR